MLDQVITSRPASSKTVLRRRSDTALILSSVLIIIQAFTTNPNGSSRSSLGLNHLQGSLGSLGRERKHPMIPHLVQTARRIVVTIHVPTLIQEMPCTQATRNLRVHDTPVRRHNAGNAFYNPKYVYHDLLQPDSSSTASRRPILPKQTQLQNRTLPTHVTTARFS